MVQPVEAAGMDTLHPEELQALTPENANDGEGWGWLVAAMSPNCHCRHPVASWLPVDFSIILHIDSCLLPRHLPT